ncbi:ABC transporter permease [Xylanimonas ulmi]|uniref:Oligopeptide transport system permease protein OppC n=1 Tax=Xylanimonas ulmi TaxID=228973 RepID=A0A4Q7M653_9MICO|nr:ABC transporter permease [Xylanibacterium ulmi]RZS62543.1 peptide/nickel transport system permease protein [Xylanibacterium ulmi]
MANSELVVTAATAAEVVADEQGGGLRRTGRFALIARRFARRRSAVAGLVLLALLILFAVFGPMIGQWRFDEPDFLALAQAPSAEHWFGTTTGGSDVFALVARGLGRSLLIGILSSVAITFVAALIGTTIAFFEGWVERVGMWILDMLLVIPSFLLIAMITRSASGTGGWLTLTLALTAFGWIGYARVLRTLTLSLRELDYVHAARYMGVRSFTIIRRHLVPNLGSVLIIQTVLGVVGAVNSETALSFLGLGVKAPDTSLGTILQAGQSVVLTSPWVLIAPSVFLVALTYSMQLIGDGLRDAIDPYSRSGGKA